MSNKEKLLQENIELSDIVMDKVNYAFETIRQEDEIHMKNKRRIIKTQVAAIAGVCILAIGGVSTVAAIRHSWGRGMAGAVQATDSQQQLLTEQGIAVVYPEKPDYESLAVTQNGITIAPNTVIVDERYAYLTFTISGFELEDCKDPGFEFTDIDSADIDLNSYCEMYSGIVANAECKPVYEDGSELEYDEDGNLISHFVNEDGNMEYFIQTHVSDPKDSVLGKTLNVSFENLGDFNKVDFENICEGKWSFEIKLPSVSSAKKFEVNKPVSGTKYTITSVEISPVSIKVNYDAGDNSTLPVVSGFVLKDGTRLPYVANGGLIDAGTNIFGFDRVIEVEQVKSLLIRVDDSNDFAEIEL